MPPISFGQTFFCLLWQAGLKKQCLERKQCTRIELERGLSVGSPRPDRTFMHPPCSRLGRIWGPMPFVSYKMSGMHMHTRLPDVLIPGDNGRLLRRESRFGFQIVDCSAFSIPSEAAQSFEPAFRVNLSREAGATHDFLVPSPGSGWPLLHCRWALPRYEYGVEATDWRDPATYKWGPSNGKRPTRLVL